MDTQSAGGFWNRLRTMFPEREFFMRSEGQVRFITISSRLQMTAAGLAAAVLLGWGVSMGAMAFSQYRASAERADLLSREAEVAQAEDRLADYGDDLAATTADLARRQDVLDRIADMLPEDAVAPTAAADSAVGTVSDSSKEADELISLIEREIPGAAGLARIEARQLAFVERVTRYADRRAQSAESAIRRLGLNPAMMMVADEQAQGGPLEALASERDGSLDPRFERMVLSLSRMASLERGLQEIPQVMPADIRSISSGFGYRRDPFNGHAAMHAGLDFRAPYGAPIHAAADGTVSFVGTKSGYGNVVEVSHGNGMITRYAHMSRFASRVGQDVKAGDVIGRIGNSGRSTGPHLHFEVRINGNAVNPRPFLESAPDVLEEARAAFIANHADAPRG